MTFLEKCLELAEDYALKKHRYNQLLENKNTSENDLRESLREMNAARQRYISFIGKVSRVNLHEEASA
jgi:hypothetical protein